MTTNERTDMNTDRYHGATRLGVFEIHASYRGDDPDQPQRIEGRIWFAYGEDELADRVMAALPKSVNAKRTTLSTMADGHSYLNGSITLPGVSFSANLVPNGVNRGVNETGVRRYASLLRNLGRNNIRVEYVTPRYRNGYPTQADLHAAIGFGA